MKQKMSKKLGLNKHQTGFTLVEVMLYLAITGLVIMIGLNAVGGRTADVRFTDSMRSLQGFVTAQYGEFVNGVKPPEVGCSYPNTAATEPNLVAGGTSDGTCILFGKVFVFEDNPPGDNTVVKVYNLVGRNLDESQYSESLPGCNSEDLRCVHPAVLNLNAPVTNQILWGTEFVKGNERNHSLFGNTGDPWDGGGFNSRSDNVRGFGWLKEPVTNEIIPVVFGSNQANGSPQFTADLLNNHLIYVSHRKATDELSANPNVALGGEFNSAFCFEGPSGQMGMLIMGEGESQEVVNLTFGEETDTHVCTN